MDGGGLRSRQAHIRGGLATHLLVDEESLCAHDETGVAGVPAHEAQAAGFGEPDRFAATALDLRWR